MVSINLLFSAEKKNVAVKKITAPVVEEAPAKKITTEQEAVLNDFKDTKFLQVDHLDVPPELRRIENQIKQNALDVIIISRTHTPVYAQKREAGYSESYKKFHGLEIQIVPIPKEQDFYSLNFFYYNWTTRKFDKRLRKRISKYNVLNEMRFALFELLMGKKFVDEHKDQIEKQNFERIVNVREGEEVQLIGERKKKKLDKIKEDELEEKNEEKKQNKLKREELEKKEKALESAAKVEEQKAQSASELKKEDDAENKDEDSSSLAKLKSKDGGGRKKGLKKNDSKSSLNEESKLDIQPPIPDPEGGDKIPSISTLYAFANIFDENVTSDGLLHASTHLRYLGFGARYVQEQDTSMPRGMRFVVQTGLPIKKENYAFPVYRSVETEIYKRKIFNHVKILAGLDLSPLYFVNLPEAGEGLKVLENDIIWAKGGLGLTFEAFGKEIDLRALMYKSLSCKSNVNKILSGNAMAMSLYYQHNQKHGGEIAYHKSSFVGDLTVDSQSLYFSYIYKFEN